jgi:hypothetical protein
MGFPRASGGMNQPLLPLSPSSSSTTALPRAGRSVLPITLRGWRQFASEARSAVQTGFVAFADRDRCPSPARHDEPNQSSSTRRSWKRCRPTIAARHISGCPYLYRPGRRAHILAGHPIRAEQRPDTSTGVNGVSPAIRGCPLPEGWHQIGSHADLPSQTCAAWAAAPCVWTTYTYR